MPTLTTVIQHSFESPSYGNYRRKRNKRNPDQKEVKLSQSADDMILHIENPKETIRKLVELISEFSSDRIQSIHRNHLHSYTLTMKNQKEKLRNQYHSPFQQKELNI